MLRMDGRTDAQGENSIPTTNKVCGGIMTLKMVLQYVFPYKTLRINFDLTIKKMVGI